MEKLPYKERKYQNCRKKQEKPGGCGTMPWAQF